MASSEWNTVRIGRDGNQFYALLGPNLQDGLAGFGTTPAAALWQLADRVLRLGWTFDPEKPKAQCAVYQHKDGDTRWSVLEPDGKFYAATFHGPHAEVRARAYAKSLESA